MIDDHLARLFAEGTAPERDADFARRVEAEIRSARAGLRLPGLAIRALAMLAGAAMLFAMVSVFEPQLEQLAESSPQFMGVPLPLVIGAVLAGLAVHYRRFVRIPGWVTAA